MTLIHSINACLRKQAPGVCCSLVALVFPSLRNETQSADMSRGESMIALPLPTTFRSFCHRFHVFLRGLCFLVRPFCRRDILDLVGPLLASICIGSFLILRALFRQLHSYHAQVYGVRLLFSLRTAQNMAALLI